MSRLPLALLCLTLAAEPVNLGPSFDRVTPAIATPAFPWAPELPDGRVRVLVLGQRHSVREVVEIQQRLDVEAATILAEGPGDWTLPHVSGHRDRAAVLARAEARLEESWDVILVANVSLPWAELPVRLRRLILERVAAGGGLLVTGPADAWPEELDHGDAPWTSPELPGAGLDSQCDGRGRHAVYRVSRRPLGHGWIVRLDLPRGYLGVLTGGAPSQAEYEHAMQAGLRVLLLAAGCEPTPLDIRQDDETVEIIAPGTFTCTVVDAWNESLIEIRDKNRAVVPIGALPAGRYWCRVRGDGTFGSLPFERQSHVRLTHIEQVDDGFRIRLNRPAEGRLQLGVRDGHGHLLARETTDFTGRELIVHPTLPSSRGVWHELCVDLEIDDRIVDRDRLAFGIPQPLDPLELAVGWWGQKGNGPVPESHFQHVLHEQGVDVGMFGGTPHGGIRQIEYAGFLPRIVWTAPEEPPPWPGDAEYRAQARDHMVKRLARSREWSPPLMSLGDEPSYRYRDQSPAAMAAFREAMRARFGDLTALNRAWGSDYAAWDEVERLHRHQAEARFAGNPAAGVCNDLFNLQVTGDFFAWQQRVANELLPGLRAGPEGVWANPLYYSIDYPRLLRDCGFVGMYANKDTVMAIRSLGVPGLVAGPWIGCYLGQWNEPDYQASLPWWTVLEGGNAVLWFVGNRPGALNIMPVHGPDWQLTAAVEPAFAELRRLQRGYARLLLGAERADDGIVLLYPTIRPSTAFADWATRFEALGFQVRLVTDRQLATNGLPRGTRLVLAAGTPALDAAVIEHLRTFTANGGILLCDATAGELDGNGTPREAPALPPLATRIVDQPNTAVLRELLPPPLDLTVTPSGSLGLFAVRYRREGLELFAFHRQPQHDPDVPQPEHIAVRFPTAAWQYDAYTGRALGRGDRFAGDLPRNRPLLLARLPAPVGEWTIAAPAEAGDTWTLTATLDAPPAYNGVAHLDLYRPDGSTDRSLEWNLDVADGRTTFTWHPLLDAATGAWRWVLRDLASGVIAEDKFTIR